MDSIVEHVVLGGIIYYYYNKSIKEKDDKSTRLAIGTAAGLIAAYKGPEIFKKGDEYLSGRADERAKDKLKVAIAGAAAGYFFGDKILDAFKDQNKINEDDKK